MNKIVFYTGKMGVGKTTHALSLSKKLNAVYLSEDEMLSSLYPNEIKTLQDYVSFSLRLKPFVKELVYKLIKSGNDVVMDFPGNTLRQREWFIELVKHCECDHKLLYLKADDELCLRQIEKRKNEQPERYRFDNKEMFYKVTSFFEEPLDNEELIVEIINKTE